MSQDKTNTPDQHPDAQAPADGEQDIIRTVETQLGQVHTARAEQKRLLQEMLDQQDALEHQDNEIAERTKKLEEQATFIQQSEARLTERTAALETESQNLEEAQAAHETETSKLAQAKAALEEQATQAAERDQALTERESAVKEQQSAFESQLEEIREKAEALKAEAADFAETRAKLEEDAVANRTRAEQLAKEKEEVLEAHSVLEADNSRLRGELSAAEAAGAGAEAASNALKELRSALDARDAQVAKLAERLEQAKADAENTKADTGEADQLRQQLETTTHELEELKNTPAPEAEPVSEQVAKRDKVIEALTTQLKDTESARANAISKPVASSSSRADLQRRDRLKAIRNSLRDKAGRLSQAKQMIDQRQAEVEQVLKLRAQLASEREALKREKSDVGKHNAKAGAGMAVLCTALAMLALAPVAWKAAGIFAPADHLASARIEIAARDGSVLSAKRLEGFQSSIDTLTTDPKVVGQAATRMERRGIEVYAQPAALSAALRDRLDVTHPAPGTAEITLVDKGPMLTQRVLETYLAAIVSAANDRASARMDNSTVVVKQAPDSTSPVNQSEQAIFAAGIWAGSSLITMLFFAFVAVAMTKARERIRNEEALLHAARDGSGIGWANDSPSK